MNPFPIRAPLAGRIAPLAAPVALLAAGIATLAAAPAIAALPANLVPKAIEVSPDPPVTGSTATLTVVVANKGGAAVTTTFYVAIYLDGTLCDTVSVSGGLKAGYETEETTNDPECQPDEPGSHEIEVVVDSGDDVDEGAEGDNTLSKTWTWKPAPRPDLVVSEVDVDPTGDLYVGDQLTVIVTVLNQGDADSKPFYVRYLLDDYECGEEHVMFAIDPDGDIDLQPLPDECFPMTGGWHDILVVLDSTGTVDESDEKNNKKLLRWKWYEPEEPEARPEDGPEPVPDASTPDVTAPDPDPDAAATADGEAGAGEDSAAPSTDALQPADAAPDPPLESGAPKLPDPGAAGDPGPIVPVHGGGAGCGAGGSSPALPALLLVALVAATRPPTRPRFNGTGAGGGPNPRTGPRS
ncbi:MAG: hypothetical protein FJ087_13790 [Deltaproteobacteria bacterium]|nr:hypothetical protein [Deltaproteobacteria bacterium]